MDSESEESLYRHGDKISPKFQAGCDCSDWFVSGRLLAGLFFCGNLEIWKIPDFREVVRAQL